MREIIKKPYYEHEWVVGGDVVKFPINVTQTSGCYAEILEATIRELVAMLSIHCKVLTVRLDVRLYDYESDNKVMSKFFKPFKRWIEREYDSELGFVWARENATDKKQHYHLLVMVDGNKAKSSYNIVKRAEQIAEYQHVSIGRCPKAHKMVERNDWEAFSDVVYRSSYFAKERTKDRHKGKTANNYSGSRITPNAAKLPLVMPQLNRPILELKPYEPKQSQAKRLTKHATAKRHHKVVNDAQLELELFVA